MCSPLPQVPPAGFSWSLVCADGSRCWLGGGMHFWVLFWVRSSRGPMYPCRISAQLFVIAGAPAHKDEVNMVNAAGWVVGLGDLKGPFQP